MNSAGEPVTLGLMIGGLVMGVGSVINEAVGGPKELSMGLGIGGAAAGLGSGIGGLASGVTSGLTGGLGVASGAMGLGGAINQAVGGPRALSTGLGLGSLAAGAGSLGTGLAGGYRSPTKPTSEFGPTGALSQSEMSPMAAKRADMMAQPLGLAEASGYTPTPQERWWASQAPKGPTTKQLVYQGLLSGAAPAGMTALAGLMKSEPSQPEPPSYGGGARSYLDEIRARRIERRKRSQALGM